MPAVTFTQCLTQRASSRLSKIDGQADWGSFPLFMYKKTHFRLKDKTEAMMIPVYVSVFIPHVYRLTFVSLGSKVLIVLNALAEDIRPFCLCLLYFQEELTFDRLHVFFLSLTFFFLLHLFSAVCGGVFHPPRIYNSLQDCSSIPGCQTIQMRHHRSSFPAHHRVMYALSHRSDWHCREASWPVEKNK